MLQRGLRGNNLFDYYLGANVTAAGLTGSGDRYPTCGRPARPTRPRPASAARDVHDGGCADLRRAGRTFTTDLTKTGTLWADTVEQLSGGSRPGFDSAIDYWDSFGFPPLTQVPFLFGLYPGLNAGTLGFANGSVAGNKHTFYTFSDNPLNNLRQEIALNRAVLRVPVTATSSPKPFARGCRSTAPEPGRVLHVRHLSSVPGTGYDAVVDHVSRASDLARGVGEVTHCGYTTSELSSLSGS